MKGRALSGRELVAAASLAAIGSLPGCSRSGAGEVAAGDPSPPTFNRDVAPIVFENCVTCHRPGEAGPFPLMSYRDVRKRASQIVEVTESRYMPPWLPERGSFAFDAERRLSDAEITLIRRWAEGGAARGDAADLPPLPAFAEGWQLGEPDLVMELPEAYVLEPEGRDVFRTFVLASPVAETRHVRALELRPGDKRFVHHVLMLIDESASTRKLDERDPGPGYEGIDTARAQMPDSHLLGWIPGRQPFEGYEDMSWRLDPGVDVVLQTHMLPTGKRERVQIEVGLFFADGPPARQPFMVCLGPQFIDIAPGEAEYVVEDSYVLPVDVEVLALQPHAHFLGRQIRADATLPGGRTLRLLHIEQWDFNWQDGYRFAEPVHLPRATTIRIEFHYDNSAGNWRNPSQPPRRVSYGWESYDEMCELWFQLLPRDPEDLALLERDFRQQARRKLIDFRERSARADPQSPMRHHSLARIYREVGRSGEAITALQRAIELDDSRALFHVELGKLVHERDGAEAAVGHYQRALELDPASSAALNGLGAARGSLGDLARAIEAWERALAVDPDSPAIHFNLGNAHRSGRDLERAVSHYRAALQLAPDHVDVHNNLAVTLMMQHKHKQAIEHFEKVVELQPDNAAARENLELARQQR